MTVGNTDIYLSLVIPAYNEERRIGDAITVVEGYLESLGEPFEIIVVDDGSSDRTLEIVRERAATAGGVRIVSYPTNRGKGYAVRQGMLVARGRYVAFSDADLSAPIEELPKLIEAVQAGYDIAIGSRAAEGAELKVRQPRYRELGGKALNLLIRTFAVPGIRDTQCGFKLLTLEVAQSIFPHCFLDGWSFDIEVLYLARRMGYKVAEVPVRWAHSADSKISPFRAGIGFIRDIHRIRRHRYSL